jgi:replicative DNA helicase
MSRVPPKSDEAEISVLGSILIDREAVVQVAEFLRPEHFYSENRGAVYEAMLALYEKREPIDVVTVAEQLKKQKALERVGGHEYLAGLVDQVPTAAHTEHYGHVVKDRFVKRRVITLGGELQDWAFDESKDVTELMDKAEREIFAVSSQQLTKIFVPIKDVLSESFDRLDELHKNAGGIRGVPTGFNDLDDALAGMQPSNLIILAARPGMGKCVTGDTLIINPKTGSMEPIKKLVDKQQADILSLNEGYKLRINKPTLFVDDGVHEVFKVETALGNEIEATAIHPLLTIDGWQPVMQLKRGDRVAVARSLPVFGKVEWPEHQVKSLAYFMGDGNLTNSSPRFTNSDPRLLDDFTQALKGFGAVGVTREKHRQMRTPTLVVKGTDRYYRSTRSVFSTALKSWLTSMKLTQLKFASQFQVSPATVSLWANGQVLPDIARYNQIPDTLKASIEVKNYGENPVTAWLSELKIMGVGALQKFLPETIFTLKKSNLALLLNRLYACEGSVVLSRKGSSRISFASSSKILAQQVKHLLLRFGILSLLRTKRVKYKDGLRAAYEVEILGAENILLFIKEIGIFGKETKLVLLRHQATKLAKVNNYSKDTLPMGVWKIIDQEKGTLSLAEIGRRLGKGDGSNLHRFRRQPKRRTVLAIGKAIKSQKLINLASGDVYWDRITRINYTGKKRVYDLTVPKGHNFLANDMVVHNTAFALNIAQHVAVERQMPVGIFSLEMSQEELVDRLLVAQADIDAWKLKTGRLGEEEFTRLSDAMGVLADAPLYIDDTPGMSVLEMRTKARRLMADKGLKLIIVDYLQSIRGRGLENRVTEVAEISMGLKNLARELKIPVVSLSQLSRAVEHRGTKTPQLADLRESGAIEQDADVVMFLFRENDEDLSNMKLSIAKHRNGPLRTIDLRFRGERIKFFGMDRKRT